MIRPKIITILLLLFAMPALVIAQTQQYDRLLFKNAPEGWATQTLTDRLTFSNDYIKGAEPLSITILRGKPLTEKPEIAFRKYWLRFFQLPDTAMAPKPRKYYNNDGIAMLSANIEMQTSNGKPFHMLTMYFDDHYFQFIVIQANSLKAFKPVQYEWLEKLQEVRLLKVQ